MNPMQYAVLMPVLGLITYVIIFIVVAYFIVKAVRKSFRLREEQNQILRELVEKISPK